MSDTTLYYIVSAIWIFGAPLIPAEIARQKGRGFWRFYGFGLLLWPVAVIVAFVVKAKGHPKMAPATDVAPTS